MIPVLHCDLKKTLGFYVFFPSTITIINKSGREGFIEINQLAQASITSLIDIVKIN